MQRRKGPRDPRLGDTDENYTEDTERGLDAIPDFSSEPPRPSWRREPLTAPRAERTVPPLTAELDTPQITPAPAAPVAPAPTGESTIDAHSSFNGRFETDSDLRVLGRVSGEVNCRGQLTIERDAAANAKVQARDIIVRGRIEGDITCSGKLEIEASAVVSGKVHTATLVVHEGGLLSGTVETTSATAPKAAKRDTAVPESEAASEPAPAPRASRGRDLPSFALVSSEERTASTKTPATAR